MKLKVIIHQAEEGGYWASAISLILFWHQTTAHFSALNQLFGKFEKNTSMKRVVIEVPTSKDGQFLESVAQKMGYKVVRDKPKTKQIPALVSKDSLAEAWDSPEDERYNDILK